MLSASDGSAVLAETAAASAHDQAVRVQNLSVTYRTAIEKRPTLRQTLVRLGRRQRVIREVRAVRNVSFDVSHGTVLGTCEREAAVYALAQLRAAQGVSRMALA